MNFLRFDAGFVEMRTVSLKKKKTLKEKPNSQARMRLTVIISTSLRDKRSFYNPLEIFKQAIFLFYFFYNL